MLNHALRQLRDVVPATGEPGRLSRRLNRRQHNRPEDREDRDADQQFNQRKTRTTLQNHGITLPFMAMMNVVQTAADMGRLRRDRKKREGEEKGPINSLAPPRGEAKKVGSQQIGSWTI